MSDYPDEYDVPMEDKMPTTREYMATHILAGLMSDMSGVVMAMKQRNLTTITQPHKMAVDMAMMATEDLIRKLNERREKPHEA